ncbi:hypothetical protein A6S26_25125 [Nostoc sp. ATCC 43529]|nr:hypothetical protein A6S26_25125 [Nostoc sp. ATCC 43529]
MLDEIEQIKVESSSLKILDIGGTQTVKQVYKLIFSVFLYFKHKKCNKLKLWHTVVTLLLNVAYMARMPLVTPGEESKNNVI